MGKFVSAILPAVAGLVIGGPLGAAVGGEIGVGAGIGTDIAAGLGGAAIGGATSALMGNGFLSGALGGGLGGIGGALGGTGGILGSGGAAGPMSVVASANDPIEAISNAMTITGTSTASDAAQALGFSGTNAMLAAANPGWLTTGAALQGGMSNSTMGLVGGPKAAQVGQFTGTMGNVPSPSMMGAGAAAKAAGMGPLSSMMSLGSGVMGLSNAMDMSKLAQQAAGAGGQYSAQYAQQLNQLMSNPNSITSMPGYQAGLEGVERSMAAQGYQGSGNMAAALQQYSGNFFNNQVSQLQSLAQGGAGSAVQAGSIQQGANQAQSSALAALGYGVAGMGF